MARPIAKDYDEKRRGILNQAARVFAEHGFDRSSVAQVAQACAISKATIYHYYGSKDDILFDILDSYLSALKNRVCGLQIADHPPREALRLTIREILLAYLGADNEHRLQTGGLDHLAPDKQSILRAHQIVLVRHMDHLLIAAAPDVFSDNTAKLRATTMSVFAMLNWYYMWTSDADAQAREEYADLVFRLTMDGLSGLNETLLFECEGNFFG